MLEYRPCFLGVREWSRNTESTQLVEDVLTQERGKTIPVCHEAQGESIAISHDGGGFYTVSEYKGENECGPKVDIPIYYYSLSKVTGKIEFPIKVPYYPININVIVFEIFHYYKI